jgi:hypothetical protein
VTSSWGAGPGISPEGVFEDLRELGASEGEVCQPTTRVTKSLLDPPCTVCLARVPNIHSTDGHIFSSVSVQGGPDVLVGESMAGGGVAHGPTRGPSRECTLQANGAQQRVSAAMGRHAHVVLVGLRISQYGHVLRQVNCCRSVGTDSPLSASSDLLISAAHRASSEGYWHEWTPNERYRHGHRQCYPFDCVLAKLKLKAYSCLQVRNRRNAVGEYSPPSIRVWRLDDCVSTPRSLPARSATMRTRTTVSRRVLGITHRAVQTIVAASSMGTHR